MNPNDQVPAESIASLFDNPRSWPEDFDGENGRYLNSCAGCKREFIGNKHRISCKECAAPPASAESVTEMAEHVSVIPEHVSAPTPQEDATVVVSATKQIMHCVRLAIESSEREKTIALREAVEFAVDALESRAVSAERELAELKADRKKFVDMLNVAADSGGFDGYDEDTEIWRNAVSHFDRLREDYDQRNMATWERARKAEQERDSLAARLAEAEATRVAMRDILRERCFWTGEDPVYERQGYSCRIGDDTALRDINYRDAVLYATADEAIDAEIADTMEHNARRAEG